MSPSTQMQAVKPTAITHKMSLGVTLNLIRALFSELCFARNIFDAKYFKEQTFGGQNCHGLIKDTDNKDVDTVLSWLEEGAFAALKDGFMSMILFGVYTDEEDPTNLREAWYFRVSDCGNNLQVSRGEEDGAPSETSPSWINGFNKGSSLVGQNTDEVTKLSSNFIRTVVALNSALDDLPEDRFLTMRLYYNPDTPPPAGWQPPGFRSTDDEVDQTLIRYAAQPEVLNIGGVATPYHSLKLKVKSVEVDEDIEPCPTIDPSDPRKSRTVSFDDMADEVFELGDGDSDSDEEGEGGGDDAMSDEEGA
ncbi:HORMA domain-containing protein, partial [Baffinella frigidus]